MNKTYTKTLNPIKSKLTILLGIFLFLNSQTGKGQNIYFPPLNGALPWDTLSPVSLGWCQDKIDSLYFFLEQENTKAFIVLKNGKIVLEKYFDTFTKDSIWYWASAGKTITAFLTGKAQEEGFLSIQDTSSKYLGSGWTNCTIQQEDQIKIMHQLTMTSGLDDGVANNDCTIDSCLIYLADPGTRWAYHNAPYTLLESVLSNATGMHINTYTGTRLKSLTGMDGGWLTVDFNNVYFSTPRSMARYGLLIQNNCIWDTDTLMADTAFINNMSRTSQSLNYSYGYLWWLNGKQSYMVPTLQTIIPGSYAPQAPADMFAGLGKNGQIVSISPSEGLVVIRMGNSPNSPASEITTVLCNQIWQRINELQCIPSAITALDLHDIPVIYPNPSTASCTIAFKSKNFAIRVFDSRGKLVTHAENIDEKISLNTSAFAKGIYLLTIDTSEGISNHKLVIN